MKHLINFFLFLITIAIFSFCKKSSPFLSVEPEITMERQMCENPFDFVGVLHNEGLDYVVTNKAYWAPTTSPYNISTVRSSISVKVKDFVTSTILQQTTVSSPLTLSSKLDAIQTSLEQSFSPIYEMPDFSSTGLVPELSADKELADNLALLYQYLSNSSDIGDLHKSIDDFDAYICGSSMSNERKEVCFIASAVLRHSATYWESYDGNSANPWLPFNGNMAQNRAINWKKVAAYDAVGAVRGAIGGFKAGLASTGLVMGPGGAILTAAGGALTWGLGASAWEAFDQWWD